jgi:lipopolysaccharide/colanic/teichoic acid biosynthesis glycosyltransferase
MYFKRIFDVIFSILVLTLSFPILILISICIKIFQGGPVLFTQIRVGKNNQIFKIFKFCTMNNKKNIDGILLPDIERISKLGSFLRRTSLDELPGFFNVLIGQMSVVGPRPLPEIYLSRYSKDQRRRHNIKPGVTGWAQVNGRNAISWKKKFELDVWYVDNKTFLLDIKILILTFYKVILKKDIVPQGKGAMGEFLGNK